MRFAICDDDFKIVGILENIVADCFQNDITRFSYEVFGSGEELLDSFAAEPLAFHVYLLDIEMGEVSGLHAAAMIRKKDVNAEIIFITSHEERMQEAFDVNAFHYLIKPLDIEKTRQVLLRCINWIDKKQRLFHFMSHKNHYSLYHSQIEFFQSRGREIIIHLTDGSFRTFYGKLDTQEALLPVTGFARAHKSYIVNLDSLETVSKGYVWTHTGQYIPVSRSYRIHFNQLYRDYLLRRHR